MADQKLTQLTEETTPAGADLLYLVDDVAGTPASKKVTVENLKTAVQPTEEELKGAATYNGAMTGTVNLDLSTFTSFRGILTGNTTITVTNTPASGESFVRSLKISSTTTESLTLPVSWDIVSGTYGATTAIDDFQIEFSNYPTAGLIVTVYINAIP